MVYIDHFFRSLTPYLEPVTGASEIIACARFFSVYTGFMELKHSEIPVEFLRALPEGIKLVNRHGREFLVVEELHSRKGTPLMSESVRIHGEPSIRFGARVGSSRGLIFIDAYWGSHAKLFSFVPENITEADHVDAFVPDTGESLMIERTCDVEGCNCTKGIEFVLPGGKNTIEVCARFGCPGHRIAFTDMSKPISDSISGINFFGAGSLEDEWFDTLES